MKWSLIFAFASLLLAGDEPQPLLLARLSRAALPPYLQVTVQKSGDADYREAKDDDLPLKFKLSAAEVQEVFGLAEKLDHFKHPLESPVKVAFMGTKTFRWDAGGQKTEVKFNYSEDPNAQALRIGSSAWPSPREHRIDLERAAKYDHLGVFKALTAAGIRAGTRAPGGSRSVPAHPGPRGEERKLHAHGARPGRRNRRSHPRRTQQ